MFLIQLIHLKSKGEKVMSRATKKIMSIVLVMMLLFSITACGKKDEPKTEKKEKSKTITGVLESFSGGIITMTSDEQEKNELKFEVKEAIIECKNMLVGDEIAVVYEGEINGTDTSNVKVKKVIDDGENTTKVQESIVGTMVDASMNTITIQSNDGKQYAFSTVGAKHTYKNGIKEGNWVRITYVGKIKGTDTSGVKVMEITDDDANIPPEQAKMVIQAVDETVYATAGVHIRASYTTDSAAIGSLAKGNSIQRTGVCANGWSRVNFQGADAFIYGDYLSATAPATTAAPAKTNGTTPKTPQQGDPASSEPVPEKTPPVPDVTTSTITGYVEDASMSVTTILVDKVVYSFQTGDAKHNYTNGIQRGNEITITYTGTLNGTDTSGVTVVSVSDTNANSIPTVTGKIINATMNTMTIRTTDNAELTFATDASTVNCANGIMLDSNVVVTIDLSAAMGTSNIFPATQIDDAK